MMSSDLESPDVTGARQVRIALFLRRPTGMPQSENGSRFGELLRRLRIGAGLSQEELATRSGLAGRTIARIEQGHSQRPHPESARRLAEALELRDAERADFMARAGWRQTAPGESGPSGCDLPDGLAGQMAGAGAAGAAASASGDHSSPGAGSGPPVPRQLPPGVTHFTGRKAELGVLTCMLDAPGPPDGVGTVVISAIGGTAGLARPHLRCIGRTRSQPAALTASCM